MRKTSETLVLESDFADLKMTEIARRFDAQGHHQRTNGNKIDSYHAAVSHPVFLHNHAGRYQQGRLILLFI